MSAGHKSPKAIALAFGGFAYAIFTLFMAAALSGAGHGWGSAGVCAFGLILIPAFGVSYAYRANPSGKIGLLTVLAGAVYADLKLMWATQKEGVHYFHRAMDTPFGWFWLILWGGWQLLLVKHTVQAFLGPELPD